jgi:hypothetical protein
VCGHRFGGGSADVGAARLLVKRPDLKLAGFRYEDDWSGLALDCDSNDSGHRE